MDVLTSVDIDTRELKCVHDAVCLCGRHTQTTFEKEKK